MKTVFKKFFSALTLVAMVSTVVLTSCSEDEVTPVPEEVTGSNIESVYYITGIVTTIDGVLSGVDVTSGSVSDTTDENGVYTLTMSSSSNATVTFTMDGYITIDATAIFSSEATIGDAVTLSQQLTAQVETKEVVAGEETTIAFVQEAASSDSDTAEQTETVVTIEIPADAVTETVDISATVYTPAATESTAETIADAVESTNETETVIVASPIAAVNLQPSGTTFADTITVSIPGDYIVGAYHAKLVDGEWEKQGNEELEYNEETGAYLVKLTSFSSHSVTVDAEVEITSSSSSSSSTETLKSEVIDNIGKVDAISTTVSYDQKSGWVLSSDASSAITSFAAGIMGSSAGESIISKSLDVAVAGDEKVTITITQKVVTTKFTLGDESATASSYGDVTVTVETEQGDMRADHNY